MRKKTSEQLALIHSDALIEFEDIQSAVRDERMQSLKDRRFYSIAGAQWEGPLGDQFENKPKFEFNKVHLSVIRIFNEYRNNRIAVDFSPKNGTEDELADACDGMLRADEKACTADEAYDNGFEEGVGGGFGAWRLRAVYEDEDDDENDRQRVIIEPIYDADSCVFFDLAAMRQDKSDAKTCYVLTPYPRKAYMAEFGDDPSSWQKQIHQNEFDWCTPDIVWVAELYKVEEKTEMVRFFRGLDKNEEEVRLTQAEIDDDPDMLAELTATGFSEVRQKRVKRKFVHKYIMSGNAVLEDCGVIPGRCIPIIPFYGKRWVVDGVERCMGHVRLAKDAQRLINMIMSWLAEMAARFDIEKPILTPEQIAGHALMWSEDNVRKFPYLLANALKDNEGNSIPGSAAPQAYTRSPNIPPAMAALAQMASQALEDMLGNQQAGEQMQPNLSGKAVELIQVRLDMQVFIYMSNLAKAKKRSGEVWLSIMRDIAVEEGRAMKTVAAEGKSGSVVINEPAYDEEAGKNIMRNDMTKAMFEVDVDVGPSSSSRRSATVRALSGMMQMTADPETLQVLSALAMMNMEGEGLSEAREFFRAKLVRMGAVKPNKEEAQAMAEAQKGAQPSPQDQALLGMAEESTSNAAQARAKTVQTIADADLKRAQTAKTLAEAETTQGQQQIASLEALQNVLNQRDSGGFVPPPEVFTAFVDPAA